MSPNFLKGFVSFIRLVIQQTPVEPGCQRGQSQDLFQMNFSFEIRMPLWKPKEEQKPKIMSSVNAKKVPLATTVCDDNKRGAN